MNKKRCIKTLLILTVVLAMPGLYAANVEFLGVETVFNQPGGGVKILPYAINLESSTKKITRNPVGELGNRDTGLLYVARVKINNKTYFRLVSGNFNSQSQAQQELKRVKKHYPGAWLNYRSKQERQKLTVYLQAGQRISVAKKIKPSIAIAGTTGNKRTQPEKAIPVKNLTAEKLLDEAKQKFLESDYSRVLAIANKVIQTGNIQQRQQALELTGVVRERRKQFAQAIAIYNRFLSEYPESPLSGKIKNRLAGLKTMRLDPRTRISDGNRALQKADWDIRGALSQYYRSDVIKRANENSEEVNSALVTDVNLFVRRKTQTDALQLRFDGGVVSDFIQEDNETRVSRAMASYTNNELGFQLTAGRQNRTAKGVYGRFDGFVYTGLSNPGFNYSVYTGYPVQSSYDDVDSRQQFLGTSVNLKVTEQVEMDIYLLHQQVSDLTDRQALGSEFQYRTDRGFLYGIIDYDIFFRAFNNITAISNYRIDDKWVLNITYDNRFAPLLSTSNALQGQTVETIQELQQTLTDDQIYQLAEDKTSRSQNLFIGSSYQLDPNYQLYLSLSLSAIDETVDIPASDDLHLAADYTIRGYFVDEDYTTFGIRLSDTSSSEIVSLRSRTRFPGPGNVRYDPRVNLDYRQSKISQETQWVLKPSFKVTYKPTRKLSLEASLGVEYSNVDLPEKTTQTTYNLFLGYIYQF